MDNQRINNFFQNVQRVRSNAEITPSEYEWAILLLAEEVLETLCKQTESYSPEEALTDILKSGVFQCRRAMLEMEE